MSSPKIHPARFSLLHVFFLLTLLLSACAAGSAPLQAPGYAERQSGGAPAMEAPMAPAAPMPMEESEIAMDQANSPISQSNPQTVERIVIKNGSVTIVVADPPKSIAAIMKMAEEMGGYVVTSNLYKEYASNGTEVPRGSVTIRVPAGRMLEAMAMIKAQSSQEPINENTTSQDVTNEYVDLGSRLKNLEAAETELTRIMEDANRTEDVLAVYSQLTSIREQIEVIKGQMKYYEQSAALSSISVELMADKAFQPIEIGGWQPQGVVKDAIESLIKTLQGLVELLIWFVIYLLPVLLILALIFVLPPALIIYAIVRRQKRKKAAKAAALAVTKPADEA